MNTSLLKLSIGIIAVFLLGLFFVSCEETGLNDGEDDPTDSTAVTGCIVTSITFTEIGAGSSTTDFIYDGDNRVVEVNSTEDTDTESVKFTYNSNGEIVKYEELENGAVVEYETYTYQNGKLDEIMEYENGELDSRKQFIYDDMSNYPNRREEFNASGELGSYREYTVDANGNILTQTEYDVYGEGDASAYWKSTFTYYDEEYDNAFNSSVRFLFDDIELVVFTGKNRRKDNKHEYFNGSEWVVEDESAWTYTADDNGQITSVNIGDEGVVSVTHDCE